ncbi:uncharacterized protein LOC119649680 isoform X2 [Hermetia illucens]|uniref:uncharacterized protein LOC119649680 isoform X2 n=1 Tax=Hermetia illucens TaxID=343691 RepID=UPI0018CC72E8|nr:uncharacterized protein LOC119649680 isoform X2 [Hermetia illucens]
MTTHSLLLLLILPVAFSENILEKSTKATCPQICPCVYSPACFIDGLELRTVKSKCVALASNCLHYSGIIFWSDGPCKLIL